MAGIKEYPRINFRDNADKYQFDLTLELVPAESVESLIDTIVSVMNETPDVGTITVTKLEVVTTVL